MVQLLSDKALYDMTQEDIEGYKLELAVEITKAPTDFEREPLRDRMDRANRILNNKLRSWR